MELFRPMARLLLLLCMVLFQVTAQSTCDFVKEGDTCQETCDLPLTVEGDTIMAWTVGSMRCSCFLYSPCACTSTNFSASLVQESGTWKLTLTIQNIQTSLTGNVAVCEVNTNVLKSVQIQVYVPPRNPTCDAPQQLENGSISITCRVENVFPQVECHLFARTNSSAVRDVTSTQILATPQQLCTMTVSGSDLQRGTHEFKVEMYLYVNGIVYQQHMAETDYRTPAIVIEDPQAALDSNCPSVGTFVKEGTSVSCTCKRIDSSFLYTTVSWKTSYNHNAGVLTLTALRNTTESTCEVTNGLGWSSKKTFKSSVAFGPRPGDMTIEESNGQTVLQICPSSPEVTIKPVCQVHERDVNPQPKFYFSTSPDTLREVTATLDNGIYTYTESHNVNTGGLYSYYCTVSNSHFQELSDQDNVTLKVIEPPSTPVIKIQQGGRSVSVSDVIVTEDEATITCEVEGGYPAVSDLTLTCGQTPTSQPSSVVTMTVDITKQMMNDTCSCMATHISACYNNSTGTSGFDVHYGANVSSLIATTENSSGPINVTTDKGKNLKFDCQADGNPKPNVKIILNRTGVEQPFEKVNLQCQDTGVYRCEARNTVLNNDIVSEKDVAVYVRCGFQLSEPEENGKIYPAEQSDTITVEAQIFGYPQPTKYTLKTKDSGDMMDLEEGVSKEHRIVKYQEEDAPIGSVSLTFLNLTKADFKNYTLIINNGVGELSYDFEVKEGNSAEESSDYMPAIVGGVVAGILLIVLGIVIYCVLKRRGVLERCRQGSKSERMESDERHNDEVVVSNMDIYYKSGEVVTDNSDVYNMDRKRNSEVVMDNSDIYNMNRNRVSQEGQRSKNSMYKDYSDVIPTMTSATAFPKNLKNANQDGSNNPYEDVGTSANFPLQSKPPVTMKPKPAPKPQPVNPVGSKGTFSVQDDTMAQTYATVNMAAKYQAPKLHDPTEKEENFYPDQAKIPEVPDKKYEKNDKDDKNEKKKKKNEQEKQKRGAGKKDKTKEADEMPMLPKGNQTTSSSYEDADSPPANVYANSGFTGTREETNVYANTAGAAVTSSANNSNNSDSNDLNIGRYRNKDGLLYTVVEIASPTAIQNGNRRPKIVANGVNYATLEFKK